MCKRTADEKMLEAQNVCSNIALHFNFTPILNTNILYTHTFAQTGHVTLYKINNTVQKTDNEIRKFL